MKNFKRPKMRFTMFVDNVKLAISTYRASVADVLFRRPRATCISISYGSTRPAISQVATLM